MTIKRRLLRRILGLIIFYGIVVGATFLIAIVTASPYKEISFEIKDFDYDSETGIGYNMLGGDGRTYSVTPERRQDFDASDLFYDTIYNDTVNVWIEKSADHTDKNVIVYGVECNGKIYLNLNVSKSNIWWLFVIIGIFAVITAIIKGLQLIKVNKCQETWKQRKYLIALYDKLGNLTIVPCSTTSYLYPNVEMMDSYYEISRDQLSQTLPDQLVQAWNICYRKLANPSKLEGKLKQEFGARSLKEFLQYKKILYIVWDEKDGYYLRKMKSVLPAPEQYVYEIVTEGRHLSGDCSQRTFIAAVAETTTWAAGDRLEAVL